MEEEMIEITVSEVLEEVKEYQEEFSPEGLCIYFAHNIGILLKEQGIEYYKLVLSDYIDTDYYHEFLVTMPNDKKQAYLIDPSYGQFTPNKQQLIKFKKWPADVLKNSDKGKLIASQLLQKGLCKTNEEGIKTYLASFDITQNIADIDFSFDKLKSNSKGRNI